MNRLTAGDSTIGIGALARQAGCTVATIRYYEQVGLIPPPARRSAGHRVYAPTAVPRSAFIRRCRDLGFSLEEVRALLALSERLDLDCTKARDIAKSNLDSVRAKMTELMTLERTLSSFVHTCDSACAGGPAPQCTIFRDLGLQASGDRQQSGCCGPKAS